MTTFIPKQNPEKWIFLQKRMVFDVNKPDTAADSDDAAKKAKEAKDAQEKAERDKQAGERLNNIEKQYDQLKTGTDKHIDMKPRPDAVSLRNTLKGNADIKNAVQEIQKTDNKFTIERMVDDMMTGILERASSADKIGAIDNGKKTAGEKQAARNTEINRWLKDNKIASFAIENGKWRFFDKEKKLISSPIQMTATSEESKNYMNRRQAEKKDSEAKAKQEAANRERTKPENLEKVSGNNAPKLDPSVSLSDLVKSLEASITRDKGKPITAAEMETALQSYINADDPSNKSPAEKYTNFINKLTGQGYTNVRIENGVFVFLKEGGKAPSSNPLKVLYGPEANGGQHLAYAHDNLSVRAQEKGKEAVAKAAQEKADKEPKSTALDGTEQEVAKLLNKKDVAEVDKRYLPALQQILQYNDGPPVKVNVPLGDGAIACDFYKGKSGDYYLRMDSGKILSDYNPKAEGKAGLQEAQKYYAARLNDGSILQEAQSKTVRDKSNFEAWGLTVDNGPEDKDGGVQYEFDWAVGLSKDPRVNIKSLLHGELDVRVVHSSVNRQGEYRFRAGGFSDMMRTLKQLQDRAEHPDDRDPRDEQAEMERRFFEEMGTEKGPEKGLKLIQSMARSLNAGEVLNIRSMRNMEAANGKVQESGDKGHILVIDWMQKLDPPQSLQIIHNGNGDFKFNLIPLGQQLGTFHGEPGMAVNKALSLLAVQKEQMTTKGGEKVSEQGLGKMLDNFNAKHSATFGGTFERPDNVRITSMSPDGLAYLSIDGMSARMFNLGTPTEPNLQEFRRARNEGYFIVKPQGLEPPKEQPATVEPGKEQPKPPEEPKPKINVLHDDKEPTEVPNDNKIKIAAVDNVLKGVPKLENYERVRKYLLAKEVGDSTPAGTGEKVKVLYYIKQMWELISKLPIAELKPKDGENTESSSYQSRVRKIIAGTPFRKNFDSVVNDNEKLPMEKDGKNILKNLPSTRAFVGVLLNADQTEAGWNTMGYGDFVEAQKAYAAGMEEALKAVQTKLGAMKSTEPLQTYDRRFQEALIKVIKYPKTFYKEYQENEKNKKNKKEYPRYKKDQETQAAAQKEYQEAKTKPYPTFKEFANSPNWKELPLAALNKINQTENFDTSKLFLSRIEGNSSVSENSVSFNVRAGMPGNEKPLTLNFYKTSQGMEISVAPGWNNFVEGGNRHMAMNAEKNAVSTLINMAVNNEPGYLAGVSVKPQAAPAQVPPAQAPKAPATIGNVPEAVPVMTREREGTDAAREAGRKIGVLIVESNYNVGSAGQRTIADTINKFPEIKNILVPPQGMTVESFIAALKQGSVTQDQMRYFYNNQKVLYGTDQPKDTVSSASSQTAPAK